MTTEHDKKIDHQDDFLGVCAETDSRESGRPFIFKAGSVAADSHPGLVRRNNEDNYAYSVSRDGNFILAAVADGIGGHENGELASSLTVQMLLEAWHKSHHTADTTDEEMLVFARNVLSNINGAVYHLNKSYNIRNPMGTTVAMLIIGPSFIVTAHSGDSRIYRLRRNKLEQLTIDHSVINELVSSGKLTPEEAESHPMAHVISKSIGITSKLEAEFHCIGKMPGDKFLICSDGLVIHADDNAISEIIANSETPRDAVKNLMSTALRAGGTDNTTIICIFP